MRILIQKEDSNIAIIGMACRFPGADNYETFWNNISDEINTVGKITKKRWLTGKHCCKEQEVNLDADVYDFNGMLDKYDEFDSAFFNISPREADNMDPQQRLLLEESWHCIEDSGVGLNELREKKTSVFVGATGNDYNLVSLVRGENVDSYASLGSFECMMSNRVSHAFGFRGVSLTLDAACASSLVALHEAKKSLVCGESDYAFASGVCIAFHPWRYVTFSKSRMMSPEGKCNTFDKNANGFVQGEGVAVLLLQRLDDAIEKGHHIYGVIKGSAVNHCGHSLTIASPSVVAQKQVILDAYKDANLSPEHTTYIEAHGTGTSIGDPVEIEALTQAFNEYTSYKQFCHIGSVKTNIGHTGSAAGIAGVIKVLLMMKYKKIPKTLNLKTFNPIIDFKESPFIPATEKVDWLPINEKGTLISGVSAFGFGGVNAHILLQSWQEDVTKLGEDNEDNNEEKYIFVLSAKNSKSLSEQLEEWRKFTETSEFEKVSLKQINKTLLVGRDQFLVRAGAVIKEKEDIKTFLNEKVVFHEIEERRWTLFIGDYNEFSEEVAKEISKYSVFNNKMKEALGYLEQIEQGKKYVLGYKKEKWPKQRANLYTFITAYSVIAGLMELGVTYEKVICEKLGYQLGLVITQIVSLEEMIKYLLELISYESFTLNRPTIPLYDVVNHTTIMPFKLDEFYLHKLFNSAFFNEDLLLHYISKARLIYENQYTFKKYMNEWQQVAVKFDCDILKILSDDSYLKIMEGRNKQLQLILIIAIISSSVKLNRKWDLSQKIIDKNLNEIISLSVDEVINKEELFTLLLNEDASWKEISYTINKKNGNIKHIGRCYLLSTLNQGLSEIEDQNKWLKALFIAENTSDEKVEALVEVGKWRSQQSITVKLGGTSLEHLENNLLALWLQGITFNWEKLGLMSKILTVSLPVYAFDRQRHWLPLEENKNNTQSLHPMIDSNESTIFEQKFKKVLRAKDFYVKDHVVDKKVILPGVAYLEMARAAGTLATGHAIKEIKDVLWIQPIVFEDYKDREVYIGIYPENERLIYEIYSMHETKKNVHSQGKLIYNTEKNNVPAEKFDIEEIKKCMTFHMDTQTCYQTVFSKCIGFDYGPGFQVTQQAFGALEEALEQLKLPAYLKETFDTFTLHPSIIDAALRTITWIGGEDAYKQLVLHIPFALGSLEILGQLTEECYAYAHIVSDTKDNRSGARRYNVSILNNEGEEVVRIKDFVIRRLKKQGLDTSYSELAYYEPTYEFKEIVTDDAPTLTEGQCILVIEDSSERQEIIKKAIDQAGDFRTIFIKLGSEFKQIDNYHYEIDGAVEEHIIRLLDGIEESKLQIGAICHMTETNRSQELINHGQIRSFLDKGLYTLLNFFKGITIKSPDQKVRYAFIFEDEQGNRSPLFEATNGFAKSILPINHKFQLLTFSISEGKSMESLINELIYTKHIENDKVSYRKTGRYVQKLKALQVKKNGNNFRTKGTYIITGGLGELGLLTAHYLAKNYQAQLVLSGRGVLDNYKKEKIRKLESDGAKVLYVPCNVTSYEQVENLLNKAKNEFGAINGIIHCAGVTDGIFANEATSLTYEQVLGPKVYGTYYLDEVCKNEDLDLFITYSSIAAVIGDYGRGSYAVANKFMDAYAIYRNTLQDSGKRRGRMISINWPVWTSGNMDVQGEEGKIYFDYYGMQKLDSNQAFDTLEAVIGCGKSQVMVTVGKQKKISRILGATTWDKEEKYNNTHELAEYLVSSHSDELSKINHSLLEKSISNMNIEEKNEVNEKVEISNYLKDSTLYEIAEAYLKQSISKTTTREVDKIQSKVALEAYGIDSIMIMELNKLLEKDFVDVPKTLFFECKNIYELANYLVEQYPEELNAMKTKSKEMIVKSDISSKVSMDSNYKNRFTIKEKRDEVTEIVANKGETEEVHEDNDIAIIGLSGKYPIADSLDEFWENLKAGRDCITEVPNSRWDHSKYYNPKKGTKNKVYCKWGGFINGVDEFDPLFFGISPKEAQLIDPQERLFLEATYESIEDAGYTKKSLANQNVAVFVGVMNGHYQLLGAEHLMNGKVIDVRSSYASIANRVSYYFDFNGPSVALDTMCSSALTAIHMACQSIQLGESDIAIAGGVNVIIHPAKYVFLSEQKFGSSEGHCRAFGKGGDGYVPAEGVGTVILKPLKKAKADGDHIYGVVKASIINHGGKTNGYTVPNPTAQADLIYCALEKAKINPETISYIEAHGTGTNLGDPIEIAGLSKAFGKYTKKKQFCCIGSVKANIGHAESAAGIASLTKVLLQMKHHQIVPSILVEELNEDIDFINSPFYVQKELVPWEPNQGEKAKRELKCPLRAGISSFGAGGTNVHLIVEEYIEGAKHVVEPKKELIILSAVSEERLEAYANKMYKFLNSKTNEDSPEAIDHIETIMINEVAQLLNINSQEIARSESLFEYGIMPYEISLLIESIQKTFNIIMTVNQVANLESLANIAKYISKQYTVKDNRYKDEDLSRIAYTLQVGREEMEYRLAFTVTTIQELCEGLSDFCNEKVLPKTMYYGYVNKYEEVNDIESAAKKALIRSNNLDKIANLWTQGVSFDWKEMKNDVLTKISLPTYPFKNEVYWIPAVTSEKNYLSKGSIAPLIDSFDSSLSFEEGIAFKKTFSCDDELLKAHQVQGKGIIPGIVQVEMACEGVKQLTNEEFTICNVEWLRTLAIDTTKTVYVVYKKLDEGIQYEIKEYSGDNTLITYSRGIFKFNKDVISKDITIDLKEIQKQCDREIRNDQVYESFINEGICYGEYFRGISHIAVGKDTALATLTLPKRYEGDCKNYILQPTLMDASIQSIASLTGNMATGSKDTHVPYKISELKIIHPVEQISYAYIERKLNTFDISLVDEKGNLCIKISDVEIKTLQDNYSNFFYKQIWKQCALGDMIPSIDENVLLIYDQTATRLADKLKGLYDQTQIQVIEMNLKHEKAEFRNRIQNIENINTIYFIDCIMSEHEQKQEGYANCENSVLSLFDLLQTLVTLGKTGTQLQIKVVTSNVFEIVGAENINPFSAAVYGLMSSVDAEYKMLNVNCIDIITTDLERFKIGELVKAIKEEKGTKERNAIALRNHIRYIQTTEILHLPSKYHIPFKNKGIYMILGGAGGIGFEISKYLAKEFKARIIMIGRSTIDEKKQAKLESIFELGGEAIYLSADGTDKVAMQYAVDKAKARFGHINGVIHAAVILKDKMLYNMNEEMFKQALDPKMKASIVLEQVVGNDSLDFMLFLSSVQSVYGNAGQCNYAAGCTFQDAYAYYLNKIKAFDVKVINWGYWGSVGVASTTKYQETLAQQGFETIEPVEGMEIINRVMASNEIQVIALKNGQHTLNRMVSQRKKSEPYMRTVLLSDTVEEQKGLVTLESVKNKIKQILMEVLGVRDSQIDEARQFIDYGVDSVNGLDLISKVNNQFSIVLKTTVIFDYSNIKALSEHIYGELSKKETHQSDEIAQTKVEEKLIEVVIKVLGINRTQIDINKQFVDYGVDSVNGLELVNEINEVFNIVLKTTILFDYPNIKKLAVYIFNKVAETQTLVVKDEQLLLLEQLAKGEIKLSDVLKIMEE